MPDLRSGEVARTKDHRSGYGTSAQDSDLGIERGGDGMNRKCCWHGMHGLGDEGCMEVRSGAANNLVLRMQCQITSLGTFFNFIEDLPEAIPRC